MPRPGGGATNEPQTETAKVREVMVRRAARPLSFERFPAALSRLMHQRDLSYRQLAYKTRLSAGYLNHLTKGRRPVPADPVICTIATALHVDPDYFIEYRLRQVLDVLETSARLTDALYGILLLQAPISDEMRAALEQPASCDDPAGQTAGCDDPAGQTAGESR